MKRRDAAAENVEEAVADSDERRVPVRVRPIEGVERKREQTERRPTRDVPLQYQRRSFCKRLFDDYLMLEGMSRGGEDHRG